MNVFFQNGHQMRTRRITELSSTGSEAGEEDITTDQILNGEQNQTETTGDNQEIVHENLH